VSLETNRLETAIACVRKVISSIDAGYNRRELHWLKTMLENEKSRVEEYEKEKVHAQEK
jgi:hypothetical protein